MIIVHGLVIVLIISLAESLRPLEEIGDISRSQDAALRNLMNIILTAPKDGRRLNAESLAVARGMYKEITRNMSKSQIKRWVRQNIDTEKHVDVSVRQDQASLVEQELKTALTQKHSALQDRPFVEQLGRNDFLVMSSDIKDSFVTVIPNALYYNVEKKCVNWLDDCSLKGIRARLLRGVQSP